MRTWRSSRPLSDDELMALGEKVERRYAGGMEVFGEDGTKRPITNLEMLANRRFRRAEVSIERQAIAAARWGILNGRFTDGKYTEAV